MKPLLKGARNVLAAFAVITLTGMPPAFAGKSDPKPIAPIYNPESKSYFELRTDLPNPPVWETAERYARTKIYKGVRGRLAVVSNVQVHSFLRANFTTYQEAWIGLRFICSVRKLVWADGDIQKRSSFRAWARRWHRSQVVCGVNGTRYMPIYYTSTQEGFHWQASGPQKHFVSYFVEYRTGKP